MSRLGRDRVICGTVGISDPRFEVEGLRDMTVRSPALGPEMAKVWTIGELHGETLSNSRCPHESGEGRFADGAE